MKKKFQQIILIGYKSQIYYFKKIMQTQKNNYLQCFSMSFEFLNCLFLKFFERFCVFITHEYTKS